jgi:phage-related protein
MPDLHAFLGERCFLSLSLDTVLTVFLHVSQKQTQKPPNKTMDSIHH